MKLRTSKQFVSALLFLLILSGCVFNNNGGGAQSTATPGVTAPAPQTRVRELSVHEFNDLLYNQPIYIIPFGNGFREVWATGHNRFIDTLIFNNTDNDIHIERIELAFATWDWTGAPLLGFSGPGADDAHVNRSVFTNVEIPARGQIEFNSGFVSRRGLGWGHVSMVDDFDIYNSMAIVVSVSDAYGTEWHNPYFGSFMEAFNNNTYNDNMLIRIRE